MILKVTLLFEKEKAGQRINYKTQTGENHTNFESRKCIFHFNCIDTRCNTDACKNILQFICFDFFSIYISSPSIIIRDGEKKYFIALGTERFPSLRREIPAYRDNRKPHRFPESVEEFLLAEQYAQECFRHQPEKSYRLTRWNTWCGDFRQYKASGHFLRYNCSIHIIRNPVQEK